MELYIQHGRKNPSDNLDDWGFDGPRLQNVIGIHVTYQTHFTIYFRSPEAAELAHQLTDWQFWDTKGLLLPFKDDLLITKDGYFGDWGLM